MATEFLGQVDAEGPMLPSVPSLLCWADPRVIQVAGIVAVILPSWHLYLETNLPREAGSPPIMHHVAATSDTGAGARGCTFRFHFEQI